MKLLGSEGVVLTAIVTLCVKEAGSCSLSLTPIWPLAGPTPESLRQLNAWGEGRPGQQATKASRHPSVCWLIALFFAMGNDWDIKGMGVAMRGRRLLLGLVGALALGAIALQSAPVSAEAGQQAVTTTPTPTAIDARKGRVLITVLHDASGKLD
jgi:hypothetical protein